MNSPLGEGHPRALREHAAQGTGASAYHIGPIGKPALIGGVGDQAACNGEGPGIGGHRHCDISRLDGRERVEDYGFRPQASLGRHVSLVQMDEHRLDHVVDADDRGFCPRVGERLGPEIGETSLGGCAERDAPWSSSRNPHADRRWDLPTNVVDVRAHLSGSAPQEFVLGMADLTPRALLIAPDGGRRHGEGERNVPACRHSPVRKSCGTHRWIIPRMT